MRALYLSDLAIQEEYSLRDEPLHHLVNVARIEKDERLLLLNGQGLCVETLVISVNKKELRLQHTSHHCSVREYNFDLALGMPKRDALELSLKQATELGFKRIFLIRTDHSQMKAPEDERSLKLLISALEQSNAPFLPELIVTSWDKIPWNEYQSALLMDSQTKNQQKTPRQVTSSLLIVGPEGGFSCNELRFLYQLEQISVVNLPTPILRTPTAVATGAGILLERLLN